jgi:C4-dicarboxylate-specific signal transduction histidine kinase
LIKFTPQPIRRQVVVAAVLLVIPLAAAVAWSTNLTKLEREREVQEQARTVAITAAAYLNQYLTSVDATAAGLARHPSVVAFREHECDSLFADVLRDQPLLLNILLTDAHNKVTCSGAPGGGSAREVIDDAYLQEVMTAGKPVVSSYMRGRVSGRPTVVLAYPVRNRTGAVAGVLGLGINLSRLQTLFTRIPLPEGSVVTLTDATSRVLARSLDSEKYIGRTITDRPANPFDVASESEVVGVDGVERFFGNEPVERGTWLLSVGIPTKVATERLAAAWRRDIVIAAFAIAAVLFLTLAVSHVLTSGLDQLRSAAQRIAGGDLSPFEPSPVAIRELGELQDAFATMAANIRKAHDDLDKQVEQERRMREALQSLQRQIVRQERLAAVGLLVSGVAHEVNNPLQAILGTAELLERMDGLPPAAREEIAFVKTQSGRAREIIRNLSRFSSQQTGPPDIVDLRDIIAEVIQLRRRDLELSSIALDVEMSASSRVLANFTELEQVVLNFVINAQQSIEGSGRGKGRILIRVYDAPPNVCVEVWDDGPGVAPDDEVKLFHPFFTTKPVGKGTGLGLSVSYGIIDAYGGSIGYRTNEWGGALFYFELPAAGAAETLQAAAPAQADSRRAST